MSVLEGRLMALAGGLLLFAIFVWVVVEGYLHYQEVKR